MPFVAIAVVVSGVVTFVATRPALAGTATLWLVLVVPYLILGALAVYRARRAGTLADRLAPRWGDLSLGAVVGLVLLVASFSARAALAPAASARQGWLFRIELQIGDPNAIQRSVTLTLLVLLTAMTEELVWRGLVQGELSERIGEVRGWLATALLYALAAAPTAITLQDPVAGYNPMVVLAALGCGAAWGLMTKLTGRLPPTMVAHAVFLYFTAVQFRIPGLTLYS